MSAAVVAQPVLFDMLNKYEIDGVIDLNYPDKPNADDYFEYRETFTPKVEAWCGHNFNNPPEIVNQSADFEGSYQVPSDLAIKFDNAGDALLFKLKWLGERS